MCTVCVVSRERGAQAENTYTEYRTGGPAAPETWGGEREIGEMLEEESMVEKAHLAENEVRKAVCIFRGEKRKC